MGDKVKNGRVVELRKSSLYTVLKPTTYVFLVYIGVNFTAVKNEWGSGS
jgi:hypothetical protein